MSRDCSADTDALLTTWREDKSEPRRIFLRANCPTMHPCSSSQVSSLRSVRTKIACQHRNSRHFPIAPPNCNKRKLNNELRGGVHLRRCYPWLWLQELPRTRYRKRPAT